jgi:glycosyltransferase involved in cell wall biosynthesis
MITVGVDIRVLGTGRVSGIEEYTERLLEHLIPLDPEVHYKLFYAGRTALMRRPWMDAPNVSIYTSGWSNRLLFAATRLTGRPYLDEMVGGADVFFFPHFLAGATSLACRRVLTMHDLSFERFPEFFSWRSRSWHTLQMRPRIQAHLADRVIAVSDSTRRDLIDQYALIPDRVVTVHSGVDQHLARATAAQIAAFRERHHLPEQFILMLGAGDPRKNVTAVRTAAGVMGVPVLTPQIASSDRALWLSAATVLAYPSFFEGFGFPPLEAMACGTPVLVSANSSMLEICGDAALAVNPYSVTQIHAALQALLDDQILRDVLIARGLKRVKDFSWQAAAEHTLEVLR